MSSDPIYGESIIIENDTFGLKDVAASTLGLVPNVTVSRGFGSIASVATTYRMFAENTNMRPWLVDQAEPVDVTSSDGSEVATSVYIEGLDATWTKIVEVVALDGTSVQSFLRVNYALVLGTTDGDRISNTGTITLTQETSTEILAEIRPHEGRNDGAIFTVPKGYTGAVTRAVFSIANGLAEMITCRAAYVAHSTAALPVAGTPVRCAAAVFVPVKSLTDVELDSGFVAPEGTDVMVHIKSDVAGSICATGYFDIVLRANPT